MSEDMCVLERAKGRIVKFSRNTQKTASRLTTKALIKTRIQLLSEYWSDYLETYASYVDSSDDAAGKRKVDTGFDDVEAEYVMAMGELKGMLEPFDEVTVRGSGEHQPVIVRNDTVRMKPIEVPSFSGDIEDWTSFRDLFKSIVISNESLTDVHRLQHLKTSCKGKAAELIKHIQVTTANFKVAWDELTKRYENNRLLVSRMLEKFLELPVMSRECPIELARLIDGTNQAIRSLAALKRPTEHWDDWLVVQTTRRLDYATRLAWEKTIGATTEMPKYAELEAHLAGVLRSFEAVKNCSQPQASSSSSNRRSVRAHVVGSRHGCFMCHGEHGLYKCPQFLAKSIAERRTFIERNNVCYTCIASNRHVSRDCTSTYKCLECHGRHHTLLHPDGNVAKRPEESGGSTERVNPFAKRSTEVQTISSNVCNYQMNERKEVILLPTAWVNATSAGGCSTRLRALIDQGSQATFLTEDAVQRLSAARKATNIVVLGIGEASPGTTYGCVDVVLTSCLGMSRKIDVKALIMPKITATLPGQAVAHARWPHLDTLPLADQQFGRPGRIDILLGADVFPELLLEGVRHGRTGEPIAQQTIFGWVLSGRAITPPTSLQAVNVMHVQLEDMLQRFWVEEEVPRRSTMSAEDEECEAIYKKTTTRGSDGRYTVELPFRHGTRELGDSRTNAIKRLLQVERRSIKQPNMFAEYVKFMDAYLDLGHMERIPPNEIETVPHCYLPHHAVLKPDSTTTKLRVVFDATVPTSNGTGLNGLLLTGPRLQETLSSILMRWRTHRFAVSADIEKMYRQIWVSEKHSEYQRIVWRLEDGAIGHFKLKTITYGTASAPYMAIKTLQKLAQDEKQRFPTAAEIVMNDFYVDDCLSGANTEEEAMRVKDELIEIMRAGGLRLLKWSSNSQAVLSSLPDDHRECRLPLQIDDDDTIKALGIRWHPAADELVYKTFKGDGASARTKRQVLSEIAKLFDPLGLLALTIVTAKIMMQELWMTGLGWDDELPKDVLTKWHAYQTGMMAIEELRIGRWIGLGCGTRSMQLHGFSDASKSAYAACVYARVERDDGQVQVSLLAAKTKVAPIKQQSIPRLELNGAVLLARLLQECRQSLRCKEVDVCAWTDSMVVLAWLRRHANVWPTYVANRVSEIQSTMNSSQWHHVPGSDNPADVASRGVMPAEVRGHQLWWTGPPWLKLERNAWPQPTELVVDSAHLEERKVVRCQLVKTKVMWEMVERYSSWSRLVRVTAYCRRMIKQNRRTGEILEADEIDAARKTWIRLAQAHAFNDVLRDVTNFAVLRRFSISKLNPFIDSDGLLRVGGRLVNADVSYDEKHPMLLPKGNPVTTLIIRDAHERMFHCGPQTTICHLHQRYWILNEKRQVKSLIHNCIVCFKARPKHQPQIMGNLPAARVNSHRPFLHTAVDYAGPIQSRTTKGRGNRSTKSWIVVFVCLSSKAIHLDLVSDMTTAAFIAAFKRFTSRRGVCSDVYSDNGTNFVGADREMRRHWTAWMKDEVWRNYLGNSGTKFHFSPPGSPHFNGLAESTVKMAKIYMRKVIGEHKLTFEEMITFLSQVEATLNSRPICASSGDVTDDFALTPGHFLIGQPMTAVPEPNVLDTKTSVLNRWQLVQRMVQHFWKRWSREYLHSMQQRTKWQQPSRNIQVGDIVVVHDELLPPTKWKMGRVTMTHPGADGIVRVATIKTMSATLKRPIVKLCVLPIEH